MRIVVQKYGGSSLATAEKISRVAAQLVRSQREGLAVVAVVSAMGDSTDELLELARRVAVDPPRRELDVLLATGEMVSAALLAMALRALGADAVSLSGAQAGILTNSVHANARILEVEPGRVLAELHRGRAVVVAGFQGLSVEREVTTLGRGGSDTTAVALAAAIAAERCEIFTDVEGVFTADPRTVPGARPLTVISQAEMQELAWQGAAVLKAEAVELARDNGVLLRVCSTFGGKHATTVGAFGARSAADAFRPRRPEIAGVAGRKDLVRLRLTAAAALAVGSDDSADLFELVAGYDMVHGVLGEGGASRLLLSTAEIPDLGSFRRQVMERMVGAEVSEPLGAVSLVGFGLGSRPDDWRDARRALSDEGITVLESFTSRESLVFVVPVAQVDRGVRRLHRDFVEPREEAIGTRPPA